MSIKKAKAGQETKYKETHNLMALELCKLGSQDKDLAKSFTVHVSTIQNWKIAHPKFFDSIREGKDYFDTSEIEESLKKAAKGYTYEEIKVESEGGTETKRTVTTKTQGPNVGACNIWLKNRDQNRWKDKVEATVIIQKSLAEVLKDAANEK